MTDDGLILDGVRKVYPAFELGPLSWRLRRGVSYGLLGPNGAGKTTLLDLIALQVRATAGTIAFGKTTLRWGDQAWKARFSYVREVPALYDELTVAETLRFVSRLQTRWDADMAQRLLRRLELDPQRRIKHLSKGTTVKVGLVAALARRVEVLLLDEPSTGLDPTARASLQSVLRDLMAEHPELCVVLSSHLFDDVSRVTTEVIILRDGQLVFQRPLRELEQAVLYRFPASQVSGDLSDALLTWRRNGLRWVLASPASSLARDLRVRPGCQEEPMVDPVETAYHATEHR